MSTFEAVYRCCFRSSTATRAKSLRRAGARRRPGRCDGGAAAHAGQGKVGRHQRLPPKRAVLVGQQRPHAIVRQPALGAGVSVGLPVSVCHVAAWTENSVGTDRYSCLKQGPVRMAPAGIGDRLHNRTAREVGKERYHNHSCGSSSRVLACDLTGFSSHCATY
jgi:hypothetical protein